MKDERWETVERCPLCGSEQEQHDFFEEVAEEEIQIRYKLCRHCGLVFQTPRMTEMALQAFYASGYRQAVQGSEEPTDKDLRVQSGRARHLVEFTRRYLSTGSKHLDIGSSAGATLKAFKRDFASDSVGVEPGDGYRRYSQQAGHTVVAKLSDLTGKGISSFDLVSLSHVIEHLPDPVDYLSHLRSQWIRPRGFLLAEVPNLFGHQALEISHLTAFSRGTLRELLRQSGFEIVAMKSHGMPRSKMLPLYLTALAQSAEGEVVRKPVRSRGRGVQLKRRIAKAWRRFAPRFFPGSAWLPFPEID